MFKKIKSSIIFSIYQVVMVWLLNICDFFKEDISRILVYLIVFLSVFFFNVLFLNLLAKNQFFKQYMFLSYIATSFVASLFVIFLVQPDFYVGVLTLSSIVIPSVFPAVLLFLSDLFTTKTKKNELINQLDEVNVQEDLELVVEEEQDDIDFVLVNENGKVLLNVKSNKILCFEANDNYAVTYYINDKGEVKKSMERISLKKIEDLLVEIGVTFFERVHKSYLININFVEEVKGKAQAYKVQLRELSFLVPVSRSFKIDLLKK